MVVLGSPQAPTKRSEKESFWVQSLSNYTNNTYDVDNEAAQAATADRYLFSVVVQQLRYCPNQAALRDSSFG